MKINIKNWKYPQKKDKAFKLCPFYEPSIGVYYSQEIDADIISTNDDKPSTDYTNSDGDKFFLLEVP